MGTNEHRQAILTAALELFARFGFKKASVEEIATRARVGKGTIYLHFASKEELFGAVMCRIWDELLRELTIEVKNAATPEEKYAAYIRGHVDRVVKRAEELRISADMFLELRAAAEPYLGASEQADLKVLEGIFCEGRDQGVFVIDQPHSLALALQTALRAMEADLIEPRMSEPLRAALATLDRVVLRGLKAPGQAL